MSADRSSAASWLERSSGVLLHVGSLPGSRLGAEAERFVDWLAAAGQSWWQILPLGPPDAHGSPYASVSAFAACRGFLADPRSEVTPDELDEFRQRHRYWVTDWEGFAGGLAAADQVRFEREWASLRMYAATRGVRIIGDLPIYVASESADAHAHSELFDTCELAGAPPDALNARGQLWGNPLHRWSAHRAEGYRWWIERFRRTFELVDVARVDHFRGFVAGWAVRPDERTAERGRWRRGPGVELFRTVQHELGGLPLIVEDLGTITPAVDRLRERLGLPGMRVLQFGFGGGRLNPQAPENHPEHAVVYTGTHDNPPARAWWEAAPEATRRRAAREMAAAGIEEQDAAWGLIRLAFASRARLAVVQMQDVLGLGPEARLNAPGTTSGNWRWRLAPGQLTGEHAERLRAATAAAGRLGPPSASSGIR